MAASVWRGMAGSISSSRSQYIVHRRTHQAGGSPALRPSVWNTNVIRRISVSKSPTRASIMRNHNKKDVAVRGHFRLRIICVTNGSAFTQPEPQPEPPGDDRSEGKDSDEVDVYKSALEEIEPESPPSSNEAVESINGPDNSELIQKISASKEIEEEAIASGKDITSTDAEGNDEEGSIMLVNARKQDDLQAYVVPDDCESDITADVSENERSGIEQELPDPDFDAKTGDAGNGNVIDLVMKIVAEINKIKSRRARLAAWINLIGISYILAKLLSVWILAVCFNHRG